MELGARRPPLTRLRVAGRTPEPPQAAPHITARGPWPLGVCSFIPSACSMGGRHQPHTSWGREDVQGNGWKRHTDGLQGTPETGSPLKWHPDPRGLTLCSICKCCGTPFQEANLFRRLLRPWANSCCQWSKGINFCFPKAVCVLMRRYIPETFVREGELCLSHQGDRPFQIHS